jgi:hypothetical protein
MAKTTIYEVFKNEFTGDDYEYSERTSFVSSSYSKAEAEKKRIELEKEAEKKSYPYRTDIRYYLESKLVDVDFIQNITGINYHKTFQEAFKSSIKNDIDYILIRHALAKGETIEKHKHKNAEEWIVFEKGNLEIIIDSQKQKIDTTSLAEVCSVHFPKGTIHGLKALESMSYFVIRDKKDKIVYIK